MGVTYFSVYFRSERSSRTTCTNFYVTESTYHPTELEKKHDRGIILLLHRGRSCNSRLCSYEAVCSDLQIHLRCFLKSVGPRYGDV